MSNTFYTPQRAMVIMAHPDDIEFSCAGTMARWAQAGAEICYVLVTSGDVGIAEPGMTRAKAAEIREAEQLAAAEVVGVREVIFLREPDGMVENTLTLRKKLVREIRRFKPEVVITTDPTTLWAGENYINHPDHRAVSTATIDAIFPAAGQPHVFEELAEEGLKAHKVRKVYVMNWGEGSPGTIYVNITDTMELKIAALKKHASQISGWDPAVMIRQWAAEAAKGKEMEYAEVYRVVTLINHEEWGKLQQIEPEVATGDA
jgi:LmbE family N-acetylglucosaminyl deacetylase